MDLILGILGCIAFAAVTIFLPLECESREEKKNPSYLRECREGFVWIKSKDQSFWVKGKEECKLS